MQTTSYLLKKEEKFQRQSSDKTCFQFEMVILYPENVIY